MIAVDTNILIYAIDRDNPDKRRRAIKLLESLTPSSAVMLWQVMQEFGGVASRLERQGRAARAGREMHAELSAALPIVVPSTTVFQAAWKLGDRYRLSYYDSLLLAACVEGGVNRFFTEDLQAGQTIEGVELVNPFV